MIKSVNQREFMAQTSFSLDLNKKTSPEHCGRNNKFVPTNNAPGGPPFTWSNMLFIRWVLLGMVGKKCISISLRLFYLCKLQLHV